MRAKVLVMVGLLAVVGTYAGYPYVTLCRLGIAIRQGDSATLAKLVDWPAVREGIKEDICDSVVDVPTQTVSAPGQLPPFGASFMRGVAGSKVDQAITPEALVTVAQRSDSTAQRGDTVGLGWSFFDSPTQFTASITTPGTEPIKVQLDLRNGAWQVTRVWLPTDMLDGSSSRT